MVLLTGAHGTCADYAESIQNTGFSISKTGGRGGKGVYFWAYIDPELAAYAKDLAVSWCMFVKSKLGYRVSNDDCVVIFAELNVINVFLDLEQQETKERLILFANSVYRRVKKESRKNGRAVSATYDLFVEMMEEELGREIDVVHLRVSPPSLDSYKPMLPIQITGSPSCYIARNLEVISIQRIEGA
ncbi:MAG: hypothetical protein AB2803_10295 [Candidatus Thiodiazotropha sp.]